MGRYNSQTMRKRPTGGRFHETPRHAPDDSADMKKRNEFRRTHASRTINGGIRHTDDEVAAPPHQAAVPAADRQRGSGPFAHRERTRNDLIFGAEPVRELIAAAPGAVRTLYVKKGGETRFAAEIDAVREAGAAIVPADAEALARMAGSEARHQGVVALVREYQYVALEDLLAAGRDPLVIVDGVTDPRNLGAIIRSAECAGAGGVIVARDRTVGVTPAAIKASAGAWTHLPIARCGNVAQALELLKRAGYWIVALAPNGDTDIYALDAARRLVFVVGSEGAGVRELVRKRADFVARIPMRGRIDSLNVSVAAAVALFEIVRRRAAVPAASK